MNYKEQIEKIALDASKARAMAKQVGVVPDGNWKWALRQLRDGRGNPLQGKALAQAKQKMGYLPNNDYQFVKSVHRKLPPNTELAGHFTNGRLDGLLTGELRAGTVAGSQGLHTHPGISSKSLAKYNAKKGMDLESRVRWGGPERNPRYADLSEGIRQYGRNPINKKNLYNPIAKDYKDSKDTLHHLQRNAPIMEKAPDTFLGKVKDTLTRGEAKRKKISREYQNSLDIAQSKMKSSQDKLDSIGYRNSKIDDGDVAFLNHKGAPVFNERNPFFSGEDLYLSKGGKESIIAPDQDYQAIHKVTPYSKRSVFFDRSPRTTR